MELLNYTQAYVTKLLHSGQHDIILMYHLCGLSAIYANVFTAKKRKVAEFDHFFLSCRFQHIFDKNPISPRRVIHQYMGDSTNQLPILDNRTSRHT